ncbi:MAG: glycosyltransferase [Coriobacteriales bacterium]|nr:glycosyltransferase [Coriobacteriales bacterium]
MDTQDRPLVSVIGAFYNIEKYVRRCMDSLLKQDTTDYEIIGIDDGSTDATGVLLDEYASHQAVRIFHKPNGGLSDARNYGVQQAQGKYVTFVDGDDFVSPYYVSALLRAMDNIPNRLVVSNPVLVKENESFAWKQPPEQAEAWTQSGLASAMCYEEIMPGAWAHLAPREAYLEIPFPVGRKYEELATIGSYLRTAQSFMVIKEPIYAYVLHEGSITHSKQVLYAQLEDCQFALEQFRQSMSQIDGLDPRDIDYFVCLEYSRMARLAYNTLDQKERALDLAQSCREYIKNRLDQLKSNPRISKANKLRMQLFVMNPSLYRFAFDVYDRFIK